MAETGSLGVRSSAVDRWQADRTFAEVDIEGHPVRIKVGPGRAKAEFDDAAEVAAKTGVPVREVIAKAETAFRRASEVRLLHPAQQPLDDR
jgi:pyridinium-3,5-bisthiocarboxylic acid mononucleotide nickel chelatase